MIIRCWFWSAGWQRDAADLIKSDGMDDVAVDFPDLKIILTFPGFPQQEEALAVARHKPNVYIDLSGWSPKYVSPILVRYGNSILRKKGSFWV